MLKQNSLFNNKKLANKLFVFWLIFSLVSLSLPLNIVFAEEGTPLDPPPAEEPTPEPTSPTENPTDLTVLEPTGTDEDSNLEVLVDCLATNTCAPVDPPITEEPPVTDSSAETGTTTEPVADQPQGTGEVVVDTGDIVSETDLSNTVNTNIIEVTAGDTAATTSDQIINENATATEPLLTCQNNAENTTTCEVFNIEVSTSTPTTTAESLLENENPNIQANTEIEVVINAGISNDADVFATTGENNVSENDGSVDLNTGDINETVNVSNLVNTNVIGSGTVAAIDVYGNVTGDLDIASAANGNNTTGTVPSLLDNDSVVDNSINISTDSDATVDNAVNVTAMSGGNIVNDNNGNVEIQSGEINLQTNIANVVNTNIIGIGWSYVILNVFGEWHGNIIVPFNQATGEVGETIIATPEILDILNSNSANVINDLNVDAGSGDNVVSGNNGDVAVATGDVLSLTQVINEVNTNIIKNNWDFVKINIFGYWEGEIYGLPAGSQYIISGNSIFIFNNPEIPFELLVAEASSGSASGDHVVINNDNSADVTNTVNIEANSGQNEVINNNGSALLDTGNVNVRLNIANYVNTNLIGNNWNYAIINIFGNWFGNFEFGRPDLWVEETVNVVNNPAGIGEIVTYAFNYGNRGDGLATQVKIFDDFDEGILRIADVANGTALPGAVEWPVGDLQPGQTGSLTYTTAVSDTMPEGSYNVDNQVAILGNENDRNREDNYSGGTFNAYRPITPATPAFSMAGTYKPAGFVPSAPSLSISKINNTSGEITAGATVSYTVVIRNTGDLDAYDVILRDTLQDGRGFNVAVNDWQLDTVLANEQIVIEYDVEISGQAFSGVYKNIAFVEGWDNSRSQWVSAVATNEIKVNGREYPVITDSTPKITEVNQNIAPIAVVKTIPKRQVRPDEQNDQPGIVLGSNYDNGANTNISGVLNKPMLSSNPFYADMLGRVIKSPYTYALGLWIILLIIGAYYYYEKKIKRFKI